MKNTFKFTGIVIIGLLLLIILGVVIVIRLPVSVDCLNCSVEPGISPQGSILLEFSKPVDPAKVEAAWNVEPQVAGSWEWIDSQHAYWHADSFLQTKQIYTFSLDSSQIGVKGAMAANDQAWSVMIRSPKILFLQSSQSNQDNGQEIFYSDPEPGSEFVQITFTSGNIYDYKPSRDGELIIFSHDNEENGRDLWIINRDGADMHKILDCGSDLCSSAVFSPDNQQIAFVREQYDSEFNIGAEPVIWLLDLENSQAVSLLSDPTIMGISPTWSPDGEWLSFWNEKSESIYVVNQLTGEILTIESDQGDSGCWSTKGNYLYYPKLEFIQAIFFNVIQRADLDNNTIETILDWDGSGSFSSYENPTCHPANNWIGLTIQPNIKIPGKEIAVVNSDTHIHITVARDMTKVPGYLAWSPTGSYLLYQLNTFSQDFENAVYVWDFESESSTLILENVYAPDWLP